MSSGEQGWDILFAFPQEITQFNASELDALSRHPAMRQICAPITDSAALPFEGGWLVALAYELAGLFEPAVFHNGTTDDYPLAWLARIPAAVLIDRAQGRSLLVAEAGHEQLLDSIEADLAGPLPALPSIPSLDALHEEPAHVFLEGVARIQDYIRSGDVFQVNLSRAWQGVFEAPVSPAALFAQLMRQNPAPFSALLDLGEWAIVSSSPERLVRLNAEGWLETRPIAGTHPRSEDSAEDDALRAQLAAHPKEQAEHVMLVDLERNDLGRVCVPGTVEVAALMEIASYRHVHHIESTVRGKLKPHTRVFDIVRATFPGGTITGCPKVRTMQIIHELENRPRRAYTGSVGYINRDGRLDLNILIRSFLLRGRALSFRAGAGIVADSVATRELDETRAKARGLMRALEPA